MKKNIKHFDFKSFLKSEVKGYNGEYSNIIRYTDEIYYLCCGMIYSNDIGKKEKAMLYKAIAYFVLPRDLFPETIHGAKGYIDDLMLCLYVLNIISKNHSIDIFYNKWTNKPSVLKRLLDKDFEKLKKENQLLFKNVLKEVDISF